MTTVPKNPFILVDGCSFLFRAYYALPPLINSKGFPTGAIYGVTNMLRRLLAEYNPTSIAIAFDSKEKTFRHEQFPEYKANRERAGDELFMQIPVLLEVLDAMGLPIIKIAGIEADDIIGTLAYTAKKNDLFTIIVTSDKDLAQLVDDSIILVNTMNNTILDRAGVEKKFSIRPELMVDFLSLTGDPIDNIPGIPMVGPKTAIKWLQMYGSLDNIIKHSHEITGRAGENLQHNLDKLALYKDLVTVRTNLCLPYTITQLQRLPEDKGKLQALFQELEFKKWFADLNQAVTTEKKHTIIKTKQDLQTACKTLNISKIIGIYVFGDHENVWQANLLGIVLTDSNASFYLSCQQEELKNLLILLQPLLSNNALKIIHNGKYALELLTRYDVTINNIFDIMLGSYVLNSSHKHDLEAIAMNYLSQAIPTAKIVTKSLLELDNTAIEKYTHNIANILIPVYQEIEKALKEYPQLNTLLHEMELPLVNVLQCMETRGILIDPKILQDLSNQLATRISNLEQKIFSLAGEEFNINSPKQLQVILFDKLKLPILGKTKTGQNTTSEQVLQELAEKHELPAIILEYRSLTKLKSTYTDGLLKQIAPDRRSHTTYQQAITSTGRLSSTEPNLQNIPIRTELGQQIRRAFVAAKDHVLLCADYSQIELRLLAHLSQEPTLLTSFASNKDIHTITAAQIFKIEPEKVTPEERYKAKAINFGLMYGMSNFGLAKQLGITPSEASLFIDNYFAKFPQVLDFITTIKEFAIAHGYVETLFGRRIYLPELHAKNYLQIKAAERAAINGPMQGSQADIIKMAMLKIHDFLTKDHPDVYMLLQVHDELIFEVPKHKIDILRSAITNIMSNVVKLSISLDVNTKIGENWGDVR